MKLKLNKQFLLLLAGITLFTFRSTVYSQCCSSGSPSGASTFVGLLSKNTIRVIAFYRNSYSDTYYEGSGKSRNEGLVKNSSFNYVGLSLGYGIFKRLTAEYEMGYFISKIQNYNLTPAFQQKGYGLANGSFTLKYGVWVKPLQNIELTVGAGFKFPFTTESQYADNVKLPRDIQPSTGAFGFTSQIFFSKGFPAISLRVFTVNKYEIYAANPDHYSYGNLLMNSLFISKKIFKNFYGILQFRSDYRLHDNYSKGIVPDSGSEVVFVSPHLSYSIIGKWHVDVLADFPVYKNYTGKQLSPKYSLAISLTRDFNLSGRKKEACQK